MVIPMGNIAVPGEVSWEDSFYGPDPGGMTRKRSTGAESLGTTGPVTLSRSIELIEDEHLFETVHLALAGVRAALIAAVYLGIVSLAGSPERDSSVRQDKSLLSRS
jgi:hypothetical protein